MSDWEDEGWNDKPKPMPASAQNDRRGRDDWDEEPMAKRHDDNYARKPEFRRSDNNHMDMDGGGGGGDQMSFTISKSNVGMVIGRGGSKIKELEQRFQVKLNIDKETDFDGNVTVTIKGDGQDANDAKREILDLISSNANRSDGNSRGQDSRNYNQNRDSRGRGNDSWGNDQMSNSRGRDSRSFDQSQSSRGRDSSSHDQTRNSQRGYESQSNRFEDKLEIYPDKVGAVIGRQGATINELQSNFKVRVNIDKTTNYNGRATVTVSGDRDNVKAAIDSIKELVGEPQMNDAPPQNRNEPEPMEYEAIDWQAAARESEEENKRRWAKLAALQKVFYKEHPEVTNMSAERVAAIRKQNNNTTVDRLILDESEDKPTGSIPNPVETFEQCFGDYPDLMEQIRKQGFEKPSPIQAQAWPVLLKGEDMIGIAQTGTGKTLAFLLPAMIHTEYQQIPRSERNGPNVLVLAPTRELALQIEKEVAKYSFRGMKAVCVYGGGDRKAQISNIQSGVEIIIATPGRLNDLVEANIIDVCTITFLILDEADRMLDMGFEPQIRKVLLNIRPDRQTVMTSATWPAGVRRLAGRYMVNPIQICVGTLDLAAVHSVSQVIKIMDEDNKFAEVMNFVKNQMDPDEKALIFCGKKARADDLSSEFSLEGICCQCMHGNRDQADREQALLDIKEGVVKILIATDVASRGIDIQDLSYVINYDFPRNIEEYVHRVGRTGRAGRTGKSISYVTRSDWGSAAELINILEEANQEVPDELRDMKTRFDSMQERKEREKASMGGGGGGRRGGGGGGGGGRFGGGGGGGGGRFGGGGAGHGRSRW